MMPRCFMTSPDFESFSFHIFQFKELLPLLLRSIQRAALWVLDQYYCDFPVYNPALLNLPKSILSKKISAFKVYNLEGDSILLTAVR